MEEHLTSTGRKTAQIINVQFCTHISSRLKHKIAPALYLTITYSYRCLNWLFQKWISLTSPVYFNIMFTFTLSKKTVGHTNSNRNTIKDIPQVGLCLFTGFWLLALKAFTYLRKSHLARPSSFAKDLMQTSFFKNRWIESLMYLEKQKSKNLFFFEHLKLRYDLYMFFDWFVILC